MGGPNTGTSAARLEGGMWVAQTQRHIRIHTERDLSSSPLLVVVVLQSDFVNGVCKKVIKCVWVCGCGGHLSSVVWGAYASKHAPTATAAQPPKAHAKGRLTITASTAGSAAHQKERRNGGSMKPNLAQTPPRVACRYLLLLLLLLLFLFLLLLLF